MCQTVSQKAKLPFLAIAIFPSIFKQFAYFDVFVFLTQKKLFKIFKMIILDLCSRKNQGREEQSPLATPMGGGQHQFFCGAELFTCLMVLGRPALPGQARCYPARHRRADSSGGLHGVMNGPQGFILGPHYLPLTHLPPTYYF